MPALHPRRRAVLRPAVLLCCALLCLACLLPAAPLPASAQAAGEEPAAALEALRGTLLAGADAGSVQEWIEGELTRQAGQGAEWEILALAQSGERYDFSDYEAALLAYLAANTVRAASTRQKYALTLAAVGSADGYLSQVLADSIGQQGIVSWIFGLHLLNNGYEAPLTREAVRDEILSRQLPDGGWAVTGQSADADVTAMALQALAPLCAADAEVRGAAERALELLSARQLPDGDFSSYGVANAESTAQVLLALSSLDIDWQSDTRFVKNGHTLLDGLLKYRLPEGVFCHAEGGAADSSATAQALLALTAAVRQQQGQGPLFLLDLCCPELLVDAGPTVSGGAESGAAPGTDAPGAGDPPGGGGNVWRLWVSLGIAGAAVLVCLALFLCRKRRPAGFAAVAAVAAVAILAVCLTDVRRPEDYYGETLPAKENAVGSVTLTIRCDAALEKNSSGALPADGALLETVSFAIAPGDTVYDILLEAAQTYGIRLDAGAGYVSGIADLYELDCGELSGWVYLVNGVQPPVGCAEYVLSDGDRIEWHYSLELGRDLPGYGGAELRALPALGNGRPI